MTEKLKKEDLRVGMYVTAEQLSEIYGVYIYLERVDDGWFSGNVLYFSESPESGVVKALKEKYGYSYVWYTPEEYAEEVDCYDD